MHARVNTIHGDPANVDAGIENVRAKVVPFAKQRGGRGVILLVDRQSGDAVAITLWEDGAAMQASEESANALRAEAAGEMGADAPTVTRYEVAVFEV